MWGNTQQYDHGLSEKNIFDIDLLINVPKI